MSHSLHHMFGPSSLERRMLCPGSYRMETPFWDDPDEDSEVSEEGDLLHAAVSNEAVYQSLPDDQKWLVDSCRDFIQDQIDNRPGVAYEIKHEIDIEVNRNENDILFHGKSDCAIIFEDGNHVNIDWKFGRLPVTLAIKNPQLAGYALGIWESFIGTNSVEVFCFQPRLRLKSGYKYSDFPTLKESIIGIIDAALEPNAPCIPGSKQCMYCKAGETCPERHKSISEIVTTHEQGNLPPVKEWKDDQIDLWLDKYKQLDKFAEIVKKEAKARCDSNGQCGLLILKDTGSLSSIENPLEAYETMRKIGMTSTQFIKECCNISVPKLMKTAYLQVEAASGEDHP